MRASRGEIKIEEILLAAGLPFQEEYIFPEYKKIYIGTYKNWFFEFKYDLKQDLWTVEDRVVGFDQDLGVVRIYFNLIGSDSSYEDCVEGYRNYIKQIRVR